MHTYEFTCNHHTRLVVAEGDTPVVVAAGGQRRIDNLQVAAVVGAHNAGLAVAAAENALVEVQKVQENMKRHIAY